MTDFIVTETDGTTVITEGGETTIITEGNQGPPGIANLGGVQLEMGETLTKGTPLYVSGNKFYAADNLTNFRVIGLLAQDMTITLTGTAIALGQVTMAGLTPGLPYFLGNQQITAIPPASGHVVRIGQAITTTELSVNIEESILLT